MTDLISTFWKLQHQDLINNEKKYGKDNLLEWPVLKKTMIANNQIWAEAELYELQKYTKHKRWQNVIDKASDKVGNPQNNFNVIHLVHHIAKFELLSGVGVDDLDCIFEFGGGYGCMCKLIHYLGFNGEYIIYDLPTFVKIQEFYLNNFNIKVRLLSHIDQPKLKTVKANGKSLFISTWALSEVPLHLREEVLEQLDEFDYFLLAYQPAMDGVDNMKFFKEFKESRKDLVWEQWEIKYIPENYYLIGYPK